MTHVDPIPALKSQFGNELARLVSGWNTDDIAFIIGTDRWRIAELKRSSLDRVSLERLIRLLARLDDRVEITLIEERSRKRESDCPKE